VTSLSVGNASQGTVLRVRERVYALVASLPWSVWLAWALGLVTFAGLSWLSVRLALGGALSWDYSIAAGAYGQIGRGNLDPTMFLQGRGLVPYILNNYDLLTWVLAAVVAVLHLPLRWTLIVGLQAAPLALVGPLVSTWAWMRMRDRIEISPRVKAAIVLAPSVIATFDVWRYWSVTFDYHPKALQGLLAVTAVIALERRRPRVLLVNVVLLALTGATGGLVVLSVGLAALLRRRVRLGASVVVIGLAVMVVPASIHPQVWGGAVALYHSLVPHARSTLEVLVGMLRNPSRVAARMGRHLSDVWAVVAGAGLVGVAAPEGIAALPIGLATWLAPLSFAFPGLFQVVPLSDLLVAGVPGALVGILAWRGQVAAVGAAIGACILSAGWLGTYGSFVATQVNRLAPSALAGVSLWRLDAEIPASAEVIAPNGIIGVFADRHRLVQVLPCTPSEVTTYGRPVNVIVAPVGVEYCPFGQLAELEAGFAGLPGATVRALPGGVLWVRWSPGPGVQQLKVPEPAPVCSALLPVPSGPVAHALGDGLCSRTGQGPGFVVEGQVVGMAPRSAGEALAVLSLSGEASVQVWDDATGRLLAQRYVSTAPGSEVVRLEFHAPPFVVPVGDVPREHFPFVARLVPPLVYDPVELRVYAFTGSTVSVAWTWLGPASVAWHALANGAFQGVSVVG
jgi:hypothetical protein